MRLIWCWQKMLISLPPLSARRSSWPELQKAGKIEYRAIPGQRSCCMRAAQRNGLLVQLRRWFWKTTVIDRAYYARDTDRVAILTVTRGDVYNQRKHMNESWNLGSWDCAWTVWWRCAMTDLLADEFSYWSSDDESRSIDFRLTDFADRRDRKAEFTGDLISGWEALTTSLLSTTNYCHCSALMKSMECK